MGKDKKFDITDLNFVHPNAKEHRHLSFLFQTQDQ